LGVREGIGGGTDRKEKEKSFRQRHRFRQTARKEIRNDRGQPKSDHPQKPASKSEKDVGKGRRKEFYGEKIEKEAAGTGRGKKKETLQFELQGQSSAQREVSQENKNGRLTAKSVKRRGKKTRPQGHPIS